MNNSSTQMGTSSTTALLPARRFVARQPIFEPDLLVFGYELLFRNGFESCFDADAEIAARTTLDSSLLFGLKVLCDGRFAFVNCTREVLIHDLITLLPPDQVIVEILESVIPDERVIAACRRLKRLGYIIALDDFAPHDPRAELCEFADIIKIDLRATTAAERSAMLATYRTGLRKILAEKIENQEEFRQSKSLGFAYFQGFFFRRPELMMTRDIPANRLQQLRLLEVVSRPELDLADLERLLKQDASVCFRLLRYLNSPLFSFGREIRSLRHAMAIIGEDELRRWIRLVVTLGAGEQKSGELVLTALGRARFCELMSKRLRTDSDLFLMGLLSLMDVVLEIPMPRLLEQIPVDRETKAVLSGEPSRLRPIYQLMLAQESGEWEPLSMLAKQLHISDDEVEADWWQAMQWAQQVSGA